MDASSKKERKSKLRNSSFIINLINYVFEYTENTSLHGIKYIGQRRRNIFERIWWLIIFIASLYMCSALIYKTYIKWNTSPVIISFAQTPTPIWQIPFPAVTICPETKVKQTVFNFTYYFKQGITNKNLSKIENDKMKILRLVCDHSEVVEWYDVSHTKGTNSKGIDFLVEVAPSLNDILLSCKWLDDYRNCKNLFKPILTEEGVCYTFNMLDHKDIFTNNSFQYKDFMQLNKSARDWSLDNGYKKNVDFITFPLRTMTAGSDEKSLNNLGLSVVLIEQKKDLDYMCKGVIQGYKVILHNPSELPKISQSQYFRILLNKDAEVSVSPDMMTTTKNLHNFHPIYRQCYFSTERKLHFFQKYTQEKCKMECLTNHTLNECKCVGYYMPHNETTPICTIEDSYCIENVKRTLLLSKIKKDVNQPNDNFDIGLLNNTIDCDCLPDCTSLEYDAEISQADMYLTPLLNAFDMNESEYAEKFITRLNIYFKELEFTTSQRNELYGITDFIANCGGLLGLFIGFSFLSAVETFYFLTLRLFCNIRNYGLKFWSGPPEIGNENMKLN